MEDGSVRKMREEWEKQMLSPYATLSVNTRGRDVPMPLCPVRTDLCATGTASCILSRYAV